MQAPPATVSLHVATHFNISLTNSQTAFEEVKLQSSGLPFSTLVMEGGVMREGRVIPPPCFVNIWQVWLCIAPAE